MRYEGAHRFHEVSRGIHIGIYDLRRDNAAGRIANAIQGNFDGK